ncbi:unnamed protein product [Cuscuta campestris]|uniref:Replication factor A C-terminal domain-containing protein n=1 Tax=Cuscuta campestris TaxID=132261 RepID=A0A484MN04_9ASTE|nr:unnamed protein product [Cuscuta campestris]
MHSWSYLGFTDCNKKVYPEDARFKCDGCDKTIPHGVYRYKVIVNVVDGTKGGNTAFVLFDKECLNLLGVGAYLLRDSMMERNLDPDMLPHELDALVCRKALFKVYVKKQAGSPIRKGPRIFSIGQIITDPKMMSKYGERTEERTKFDDLWDNVVDLTQCVEKGLWIHTQ